MNEIQTFSNIEFGKIRTMEVNNKPYFVGSDIVKVLGYKEPHKAISRHCKGGITQFAKQVGIGEYHLFANLRGKKVLFYEVADNVSYERFRKNGCFKVIDTVSPDGKSHSTTRATQKGLGYICKIIRKDNEEVA